MHILQAPKHSMKRTMASIGSVFSLNSPRYQFLDCFHMTGCICALRTTGKTSFHFGKVHIKEWMKAGRSTGYILAYPPCSSGSQRTLSMPKVLQTFYEVQYNP